jgi:plastocyanin
MNRRRLLCLVASGILWGGAGCGATPSEETTAPPRPTGTPTATLTESDPTERPDTTTPTATETRTPRAGTVDVDVGPGFFFRPAAVRVRTGTTVRWVWRSDGHNVAVDVRPDESSWRGMTTIADEGFTYEFTFSVPGTYRYVCEPHVRQGMAGRVTVV